MREMKTEEQIDVVLNRLPDIGATRFKGMTYEEGIADALQWVLSELGYFEKD